MWQVIARYMNQDYIIHDDRVTDSEVKIISPVLTLEDNKSGSLEFTIAKNNNGYSVMNPMQTECRVTKNGKIVWFGRVLTADSDFYNRLKIHCEGGLSYLCDFYYPVDHLPDVNYRYAFPLGVNAVMTMYNDVMAQEKFGNFDLFRSFSGKTVAYNDQEMVGRYDDYFTKKTGSSSYAAWPYNERSSMTLLDWIVTSTQYHNGHVYVTRETDSSGRWIQYLNFQHGYNTWIGQEIRFGENLLDYAKTIDGSSFHTAVRAYGTVSLEDEEETYDVSVDIRLILDMYFNGAKEQDFTFVQNGITYTVTLDYERNIAYCHTFDMDPDNPLYRSWSDIYGIICRPLEVDTIDREQFIGRIIQHFITMQPESLSITVKAADLAVLGVAATDINILDTIHVVSKPHNVDGYFPVTKIEYHLDDPSQTTYTIDTGAVESQTSATGGSSTSVDTKITSASYKHPTYAKHEMGLYKFSNDEIGSINNAQAVTKKDITDLGIPGENTDTTYYLSGFTTDNNNAVTLYGSDKTNTKFYLDGFVKKTELRSLSSETEASLADSEKGELVYASGIQFVFTDSNRDVTFDLDFVLRDEDDSNGTSAPKIQKSHTIHARVLQYKSDDADQILCDISSIGDLDDVKIYAYCNRLIDDDDMSYTYALYFAIYASNYTSFVNTVYKSSTLTYTSNTNPNIDKSEALDDSIEPDKLREQTGYISSGGTEYTAGENITIENGVISAKDTTYEPATTTTDGLMSAEDKKNLDTVVSGPFIWGNEARSYAKMPYHTGTGCSVCLRGDIDYDESGLLLVFNNSYFTEGVGNIHDGYLYIYNSLYSGTEHIFTYVKPSDEAGNIQISNSVLCGWGNTFIRNPLDTPDSTGYTAQNSVISGSHNIIYGNNTVISGIQNTIKKSNGIVAGTVNTSSSDSSVVAGESNNITGSSNIIGGLQNNATLQNSCLVGAGNYTIDDQTIVNVMVCGVGNIVGSDDALIGGLYGKGRTDILLELGNGTGTTKRSDAVYITKTGDIYCNEETTSLNAQIDANTAARHTHDNKDILDATTASYTTEEKTKLSGIATGAQKNVQSDWNATSGDAFIKNKPTIPDISGKQDKSTAVTHTANTAVGSTTKPVYVAANGVATAITHSINADVPANAKFTDTTYSDATQSAHGLMTAADKKKLDGMDLSKYLPLAGGTMSGNIDMMTNADEVIISDKPPKSDSYRTLPMSGLMNGTSDSMQADLKSKRSFIGSYKDSNSVYHNFISVRHRNGYSDGSNYGMYLQSLLTSSGNITWNKQIAANTWQGERVLLDSANYSTYAAPLTHYHKDIDRLGNVGYYGSDEANTSGWYKFYSGTLTGYNDRTARLMFTYLCGYNNIGTLFFHVRCNNSNTLKIQRLQWEVRQGFDEGDVIAVTNGNNFSLYVNNKNTRYGRIKIRVLESGTATSAWNMSLTNNLVKESTAPTPTVVASDGCIVAQANTLTETAWTALDYSSADASLKNDIKYKKYGKIVYISGTVSPNKVGSVFNAGSIPSEIMPTSSVYGYCTTTNGDVIGSRIIVAAGGKVEIFSSSNTGINPAYGFSINLSYLLD